MRPPTDDIRQLHRSTAAAFDEAAAKYADEVAADIDFLRAGGQNFCQSELPYLEGLADWCRRAIHLQCAGGRDTLSLWNRGAHAVVGVDISPRMIACAQQKSAALDAPAAWHCCDVLDTPAALNNTADLVYSGRGAVCWIMDLQAWAAVVTRLLRPGGRLYLFDGHPVANLWDQDAADLRLDDNFGDYFQRQPIGTRGWGSGYIGDLDRPVGQQAEKFERSWNLGQIVTAVIDAGLQLTRLEEHPEPYYDAVPQWPSDRLPRLPQTFSLVAFKPQ